MNSKITISLGIVTIVVAFALDFIVGNQQTFAANLCGSGFCEPNSGISYPSPLSHFFGGDVLHSHGGFHHWHGGFGYHHHH
jgi:hypothetical protein